MKTMMLLHMRRCFASMACTGDASLSSLPCHLALRRHISPCRWLATTASYSSAGCVVALFVDRLPKGVYLIRISAFRGPLTVGRLKALEQEVSEIKKESSDLVARIAFVQRSECECKGLLSRLANGLTI